ncbi:Cloroperoxidase [Coprinopsis marcescibilis]|uniref:Cloroperoxidase n=1 Tax=Coprinopsis marcescibilis TaxID=230819 RepID=A0A5C3KZN9_COPMA|nr:Cloroperoxidase [Coprinopsis marcescibilis]
MIAHAFNTSLVILLCAIINNVAGFPSYASPRGLRGRQAEDTAASFDAKLPPAPPGPSNYTRTKLVDDASHPWQAQRPGDIRGPCPGMNTLASHGYLPRDGVATPAEIVQAVQDGFNMENSAARVVTYSAHLLDGNLVTDLISIGGKTTKSGPSPPLPALAAGLSNHGTSEGDASLTALDAYFGDGVSFNQPLFDQLVEFSNQYGGGYYNLSVAAELRYHRVQESIATNPEFSFTGFRHNAAYSEAVFLVNFFVDGRHHGTDKAGQLDMDSALSFFRDNRFPKGFFRAAQPTAIEGIDVIYIAHPVEPGRNVDGVDSYVADHSLGSLVDTCTFYTGFVNVTVRGLYPEPTGALLRSLNINLGFFYDALVDQGLVDCPRVFPYGQG